MAKSFFDMTNGEILTAGAPRVNLGLLLGFEVRITAQALPDRENRKGVYRYTARIYKGRKHIATTQDTNFYHLIGVMLAGELERLTEKMRSELAADEVEPPNNS